MKILIFLLALTITNLGGILVAGDQSSNQMQEPVRDKVPDIRQDLNAAQKDSIAEAQEATSKKEWKSFNKRDFELKIKANELRITKLNAKIRKPAELFDPFYLQKIANLEKENRFLKSRLEAFEKSQSSMGATQAGFF